MFIENEITRQYNGMDTMEEAIGFLRYVYGWSVFKEWLERDYESILVSIELLSIATRYEVMLAKMLLAVPTESERYKLLSEKDKQGRTLLHDAAKSSNPESIKTVLALFPESERLNALSLKDRDGRTALYCAVSSNRVISNHSESTKLILTSFPESERLQAVCAVDNNRWTVLHRAASSKNPELIKLVLSLLSETERLQVLNMQDQYENTV